MFGDDAIDEVNRRFYSVCPADYLETRRALLTSLDVVPEDDESKVALARFQVLESTVLAHHAFEALVRLYLAHSTNTTCPWIEVAGETSFSAFKSRVNDEIIGPSTDALAERMVPLVFLGSVKLTNHQQTLVHNTAGFLRSFAGTWLDDARLYNAAKHGLAVVPGQASLSLGETGGEMRAFGRGTAIEFLEHHGWQADTRKWSLTTVWASAQETLTEVEIACMLIRSLWAVGRRRFGIDTGPINVVLPSVLPKDLPRDAERGSATRMSWGVIEERR